MSAAIIGKVVFTSSESTMGFAFAAHRLAPLYIPVDEAHPARPQDPYGLSKVVSEQICKTYTQRYGMRTVCLRMPWVWLPDDAQRPFYRTLVNEYANWYKNIWTFVDARDVATAHRLALDHPKAVKRLVLLDIAPTLAMYEKTSNQFARSYWHWFFLIQPAPMPERLIEADPAAYVRDVLGRRSAGLAPFDARALAEYVRCLELPGTAHGLCEDYRASAGIDLVHDQLDLDEKNFVKQPLLVLWGEQGVVHQCFEPLKEWSKVAVNVQGKALPCGHYIPEEAPELLLDQVKFF